MVSMPVLTLEAAHVCEVGSEGGAATTNEGTQDNGCSPAYLTPWFRSGPKRSRRFYRPHHNVPERCQQEYCQDNEE